MRASEVLTYYEELELDIDHRVSPSLSLNVFVRLGEGEAILHQSASYEVEPCQEHRVRAAWSAGQVTPGSSVNLEISSDQESLCAVSATDKVIKSISYMETLRHKDLYSVCRSARKPEQDFERDDWSTSSQDCR